MWKNILHKNFKEIINKYLSKPEYYALNEYYMIFIPWVCFIKMLIGAHIFIVLQVYKTYHHSNSVLLSQSEMGFYN